MAEVIVTAGGTREKIDDVRYVGNFSSGALGLSIAEAYRYYSKEKNNVTLIAPNETVQRFGIPYGVRHLPFRSTEELRGRLLGIKAADTVIHSAAVADYMPVAIEGKISSDQEELVVRMKRISKVIAELRDHFGEETKLVGFKLLSGATKQELFNAAVRQIEMNSLDYCVANDMQEIMPYAFRRNTVRTAYLARRAGDGYEWERVFGNNAMVSTLLAMKIENDADMYERLLDRNEFKLDLSQFQEAENPPDA